MRTLDQAARQRPLRSDVEHTLRLKAILAAYHAVARLARRPRAGVGLFPELLSDFAHQRVQYLERMLKPVDRVSAPPTAMTIAAI
jgi:hypothetical protein